MGLLVTGLAVARERELGTFEQLLVSPLSPGEIIVGKTVPALLIGLGEATGMILVGRVCFSRAAARLGHAAVCGHGRVSVGRDRRRPVHFVAWPKRSSRPFWDVFAFMVPAILLSGFASPIENMPDWLQWVTLANPIRYFIVIVKGIFLKDLPVSIIAGQHLADGGDRLDHALVVGLAVPPADGMSGAEGPRGSERRHCAGGVRAAAMQISWRLCASCRAATCGKPHERTCSM